MVTRQTEKGTKQEIVQFHNIAFSSTSKHVTEIYCALWTAAKSQWRDTWVFEIGSMFYMLIENSIYLMMLLKRYFILANNKYPLTNKNLKYVKMLLWLFIHEYVFILVFVIKKFIFFYANTEMCQ